MKFVIGIRTLTVALVRSANAGKNASPMAAQAMVSDALSLLI
jgi:hypothetical protein